MGKFKVSGFLTSKQIKYIPDILAGVLAALCIGGGSFWAYVRLFGLKYTKENWHTGSLTGGLVKTWNDIADTFGRTTYTILNQYADPGQSGGLFLTFVLIVLILLAGLIVASGNLWFSLLYLLPIMFLAIVFHLGPGFTAVILIATGFSLMVIRRAQGKNVRLTSILLVCLIGAVSWGLSAQDVTHSLLNRPGALKHAAKTASTRIETMRYGKNPLKDGEMDSSGKARKSTKTALRVTMEEPDAIYLRGFTGEIYDGKSWQTLPTATHYNARPLVQGLHLSGLDPLSQLTMSAALGDTVTEESQQELKVETVNASSRYAYVPYEIADRTVKNTNSWTDSFLTGKGLRGIKEYKCKISENLTGLWTDIAGALYSHEYTEDLQFYQMSESRLNVWIYDHYTDLDDSTAELLAEEIGTRGNQEKGHVEYKTAINQIYSYFGGNIVLSNSAKPGDDPLVTLFENYSGNDEMIATAATEMFRYYGIPARYVEGYLVTLDDVDQMEPDESYDIPMKNAHAWTEIYVDGVGWIPIEVTDDYRQLMPEADMEAGLQTTTNSNPFYQSEHSGSSVITQQENDDNIKLPVKKIFMVLLLILLALLAAFLIWKLGPRALKAWRRRKAFRQPDAKAAVAAMYGYALEKKLPLTKSAHRIGQEAAYSEHTLEEMHRVSMLAELKSARKQAAVDRKNRRREKLSSMGIPKLRKPEFKKLKLRRQAADDFDIFKKG